MQDDTEVTVRAWIPESLRRFGNSLAALQGKSLPEFYGELLEARLQELYDKTPVVRIETLSESSARVAPARK